MGEPLNIFKPSPERICLQITRWQMVAMVPCVALIVGGHLIAAYAAYYNLDNSFPHPVGFGLVASGLCLFYLALGAYAFIAADRDRIWLYDNGVVQRGIFRIRQIEWQDVLSVDWRAQTFRVIIEAPASRICIWLNTYPFVQQQQVVELIRNQIPKHKHQGYRQFRKRYEEFHCVPRGMTLPEARNSVTLLASLLFLTSASLFAAWFCGVEGHWLESAVFCAIAGAFYILRYRLFKARYGAKENGHAP
jgi:hypothetical protein